MSYKNFKIQYDTYYDKWLDTIQTTLEDNGFMYYPKLPNVICKSLRTTLDKFLFERGYKPSNYLSYRKGLVTRLRNNGLNFVIQSNSTMWSYLEYFTDLTDYEKCFDIYFEIVDTDKALKVLDYNLIQDRINATLKGPIHTDDYRSIEHKLYMLETKIKGEHNNILKLIVEVLQDINRKGD